MNNFRRCLVIKDEESKSKIIVNAINETIAEFENESDSVRTEADLQLRLYQKICNKMGEKSYRRVSGEYPIFKSEQKENNKNYASKLGNKINYFDEILDHSNGKYKFNNKKITKTGKEKTLFNDIIPSGRYDLVVFNKDETNVSHVIEIKKLNENEIHPEMANRHRALEDIFVLTDLIKKDYNDPSIKLEKNCRGYNLIFVKKGENSARKKDDYEKMKSFIIDVKDAYEKAGIYYLAIGFDEELKEKLDIKSVIRCGDFLKNS